MAGLGSIHIKPENKGKGLGGVTAGGISAGKNSPDPAARKCATLAANTKKWHHGSNKNA